MGGSKAGVMRCVEGEKGQWGWCGEAEGGALGVAQGDGCYP